MVKVKVISRSRLQYEVQSPGEIQKVRRNLNPVLHPFERAVEYTRAINAAKLERVFAKPFICAFNAHVDTVQCIAKHPTNIGIVATADCSGDIRVWDIPKRKALQHIGSAHKHMITGVAFIPDGQGYLSCSKDLTVKLWKTSSDALSASVGEFSESTSTIKPVAEFLGEHAFDCITHHQSKAQFATAAQNLLIWDINRTRPISTFCWGDEPITACSYNRSETSLIVCCMQDRAVCLFDERTQRAIQKAYFANRTNSLVWNPMRPMEFAVGSEDCNAYACDARYLAKPRRVLTSHVDPVLSVDFSPTGLELVTGSYDRSIRIWDLFTTGTHWSRDVYTSKRMQRVWCVSWTSDNNFILSGSDDHNLRVWKAFSSKPLKKLTFKEQRALQYNDKLKERFGAFPEVNAILRRRKVPRAIVKAQRVRRTMQKAEIRRDENRKLHTSSSKKREGTDEEELEGGGAIGENPQKGAPPPKRARRSAVLKVES